MNFTARAALAAVLLVACSSSGLSSPSARFRRDLTSLPDGIPLQTLFSACGESSSTSDIGPCVQQLVQGAIELSRPQFSTGIMVKGKKKILDPLSLKDIPEKPGKQFRFSLRNLKVHGLSTVTIEDVKLEPAKLAIEASFAELKATSEMTMRYSFIRGDTEVEINLHQPRVRVEAGWSLTAVNGKLGIQISDPKVDISINDLSTRITKLGGLGGFLQGIINSNSGILLQILVPELERQAEEKLTQELGIVSLS